MQMSRARPALLLLVCVFTLAPISAQAQSYFAPLATPPASVGTCRPFAARPSRTGDVQTVERRLVIMSTPPGESRDVMVATGRGRAVYSDMTFAQATMTRSTNGRVFAVVDSLGRVRGYLSQGEITLPPSVAHLRHDSTAIRYLQHLRDSMRSSGTRTPLSGADQARVRSMIAWMQKRCP